VVPPSNTDDRDRVWRALALERSAGCVPCALGCEDARNGHGNAQIRELCSTRSGLGVPFHIDKSLLLDSEVLGSNIVREVQCFFKAIENKQIPPDGTGSV